MMWVIVVVCLLITVPNGNRVIFCIIAVMVMVMAIFNQSPSSGSNKVKIRLVDDDMRWCRRAS